MPLIDIEIRKAKPSERLVKLSDGGGLQLWIMPARSEWRLAYRFGGGQKTLAIGVYPETGLREARDAREEAKRPGGSAQPSGRSSDLQSRLGALRPIRPAP